MQLDTLANKDSSSVKLRSNKRETICTLLQINENAAQRRSQGHCMRCRCDTNMTSNSQLDAGAVLARHVQMSCNPAQNRSQLESAKSDRARAAWLTMSGRIDCSGAGEETCSRSRLPSKKSSTPVSLSMQSNRLVLDSPSRLGAASNSSSSCDAMIQTDDRVFGRVQLRYSLL